MILIEENVIGYQLAIRRADLGLEVQSAQISSS